MLARIVLVGALREGDPAALQELFARVHEALKPLARKQLAAFVGIR